METATATLRLDVRPAFFSESLALLLKLDEPHTLLLENDPTDLGELFEEVLYAIQASPHTVDVVTEFPRALGYFMRETDERRQLCLRTSRIRWGVVIATDMGAAQKMPEMDRWPCTEKFVMLLDPSINLSPWEPHQYSTVGHSGVCEDCGFSRAANRYHAKDAQTWFRRADART